MNTDVAIDLGTASVLIYIKGKGIVLQEPSVVIVDKMTGHIIKVGREAQEMIGRTPENVVAVRPLCDGVISQYQITLQMLQIFLKRACGSFVVRPNITICVPGGITDVEERAVYDAATEAGAKEPYLIEEPIAAAIGAGIDISQPEGNMIIDIGGGTTDIAVISMCGVASEASIKVAGDKMNQAIIRYCRRKHGVLIGEATAEEAKIKVGAVWRREDNKSINIKGKSKRSGTPTIVTLTSHDMIEALEEPITSIVEAVCNVIERTPPELVSDIYKNGIVMTGGGSLIYGIDKLIANVTGIPTRVAERPISCVAIGTGRAGDFDLHLSRGRAYASAKRGYARRKNSRA